jgi:hypothetical protein
VRVAVIATGFLDARDPYCHAVSFEALIICCGYSENR